MYSPAPACCLAQQPRARPGRRWRSSVAVRAIDGEEGQQAGPSGRAEGGDASPSSSSRSGAGGEGADDAPLTISKALSERMARLKALEDYKRELEEPEGPDTLMRCALQIARHRDPDLDESKVFDLLDEIARRAAALLPETRWGALGCGGRASAFA